MKTRTLGRTGVQVSELIFGCGNVGGMMIHKPPEEMKSAVKDALAAGINWFDTAAQYGDGKSEENLGKTLRALKAEPYVSTKGTVTPADPRPFTEQMEETLNASLTRLGMDRIELFQLHGRVSTDGSPRALSPEQVLGPNGAIEAMERLRDKGKFKWIGMTGLGDTQCILQTIESGRLDCCQVYVNIINPTASHAKGAQAPKTGQDFAGVMTAARARNLGVIAIRTLAAGVLAGAPSVNARAMLTKDTEIGEEIRKADAVFAKLGTKYGTRAQTALRYALALKGVSCIDFAIGELAHLPEGLKSAEMGPLPPEAMSELAALVRNDFTA